MPILGSIGIVGGGTGGLELLTVLSESPSVEIAFVVDLNAAALGMQWARGQGIPTTNDVGSALERYAPHYVIEATGSPRVLQSILDVAPPGVQVLSSKVARFFFDLMEENRIRANQTALLEVQQVQKQIVSNAERVNHAMKQIKGVTDDLKLLAINARIEAASAGVHGQAFAVVAEEVKATSTRAIDLSVEIVDINLKTQALSERLDAVIERLR